MLHAYGRASAVSLCFLYAVGSLVGQTRVAPLYTLPDDGTWVEYEFLMRESDDKEQKGTLRISSVGRKKVKDEMHRWIEISLGRDTSRRICKLLIAESAFAKDLALPENVAEAYEQKDGDVFQMTGEQTRAFLTMGFTGELKEIRPNGTVETKLGTFTVRCVAAVSQDGAPGATRVLDYRGRLTKEIPFGWATFVIWEKVGDKRARIMFSAKAVERGKQAKSVIDESKTTSEK